MSAHRTDFSTGKVSRAILELALPMTMAQLVNLLYNIVDRMYIGKIPGTGDVALARWASKVQIIKASTQKEKERFVLGNTCSQQTH